MKTRTLLAVLALAMLAACTGDTPTGARAPGRAALDGAPADSASRGGSLGPGH